MDKLHLFSTQYQKQQHTSTLAESNLKKEKNTNDHPFCWACAFYQRNLDKPHSAKFCRENSTFNRNSVLVMKQFTQQNIIQGHDFDP